MNNRLKTTLVFSFIFGSIALLNTTRVHAKFDDWFTDEAAAKKLGTQEEKDLSMWEKFKAKRYKAAREKESKAKIEKRRKLLAKLRASATKEKECTIKEASVEFERIYKNYKATINEIRQTLKYFESSSVAKLAILNKDEVKQIEANITTLVKDLEDVINEQEKLIQQKIAAKKDQPILNIPEAGESILNEEANDEDSATKKLLKIITTQREEKNRKYGQL